MFDEIYLCLFRFFLDVATFVWIGDLIFDWIVFWRCEQIVVYNIVPDACAGCRDFRVSCFCSSSSQCSSFCVAVGSFVRCRGFK